MWAPDAENEIPKPEVGLWEWCIGPAGTPGFRTTLRQSDRFRFLDSGGSDVAPGTRTYPKTCPRKLTAYSIGKNRVGSML